MNFYRYFYLAIIIFTSCSILDSSGDDIDIQACFFWDAPLNSNSSTWEGPVVNQEITFRDCSNQGEQFIWDFGDGNTATNQSPRHTYTSIGSYTVKLTVMYKGEMEVKTQEILVGNPIKLIKVNGDNQVGGPGVTLEEPLVVQITDLDNNPVQGLSVSFESEGSSGIIDTDEQGNASFNWTMEEKFGDQILNAIVQNGTGSNENASFYFVPENQPFYTEFNATEHLYFISFNANGVERRYDKTQGEDDGNFRLRFFPASEFNTVFSSQFYCELDNEIYGTDFIFVAAEVGCTVELLEKTYTIGVSDDCTLVQGNSGIRFRADPTCATLSFVGGGSTTTGTITLSKVRNNFVEGTFEFTQVFQENSWDVANGSFRAPICSLETATGCY